MISCLAGLVQGIIELQGIGIFNASLDFKSLIKSRKREGYKVGAFDWVFKVRKCPDDINDRFLKKTRQIVEFWLLSGSKHDEGLLNFIFRSYPIICP